MPNERARSFGHSVGRLATRKQAPQGGSVEASSLHGADVGQSAVLPKRSDSPKGVSHAAYRGTGFIGPHAKVVRCRQFNSNDCAPA